MHLVFAYGTLRRHESNARLLADAERVAEQAWVHGTLYDTGCGYPALVCDSSPGNVPKKVYGELIRVTDEQLAALDELEGYQEGSSDNHYERVVGVVHTDREDLEAYLYVYPPERAHGLAPIRSGDWKCYLRLPDPEEASVQSADEREGEGDGKRSWLYFAYGSCMDDQRFRQCGVHEWFQDVIGRGVLRGYEIAFTHKSAQDGTGRADILETGGVVEGRVYRIGRRALAYLYAREGVREGAYRPTFVDVEVDGRKLTDVLTFTVVDKATETPPPDWYAEEILRGAWGVVSPEYYQYLVEKIGRLKKILR